MIQIVHLPPARNAHRVDGVAVVSLTAYVDVYLIMNMYAGALSCVAVFNRRMTQRHATCTAAVALSTQKQCAAKPSCLKIRLHGATALPRSQNVFER